MALRIEKRTRALLTGLALLALPVFAQQEFRYEAWHGHSRPPHIRKAGSMGTLTITDSGVSFEEGYAGQKTPEHVHSWRWKFDDIQQLTVAPKQLTVLTYKDNKWKLGADRAYEFDLESDQTFEDAYTFLKGRLDQRLVATLNGTPAKTLWGLPVKHLTRFGGDEGVLRAGEAEIVYQSERESESRVWRYDDIENISSSGPFQLSITTYERARLHYGSLKGFNFQLKQKLTETRYNELWLRLNRQKGLNTLESYR